MMPSFRSPPRFALCKKRQHLYALAFLSIQRHYSSGFLWYVFYPLVPGTVGNLELAARNLR